ncbi:tetratricopeptide repeat protein [uncultured Dokdonia sp.]|uniref:tetratricopeptide repeat protein n=1 Tax=uncultured Dokdonia sp. TaxID=575653 RepID=UPI0026380AED|nr:tetratricopeptide repeat protein [uncultured Dokdonia sp.]
MEPLSSFAISIAAGVALEIYPAIKKFRAQGVDKQIKVAFDKALKDWSVNEEIRVQKERELRSLLQSHIEQRDIITKKIVKPDTLDFLRYFEKRLVEQSQAHDYLRLIVDQERHDEIVIELSTIKEQLSEIQEEIKKGNIDARDIGDWLDKIDFKEGKEEAGTTIQHWYAERVIDPEMKEVLLLATKKIYERTDELTQEIEELKSQGNTYLATILEKIKEAVQQRKPKSLTAIYEAYKQKEKEDKIELLQELIDSSKAIFAYEEAIQFYKDLIVLEPSANNHFKFGYFLQEFNFLNDAIDQYEIALIIYKNIEGKYPHLYLSDISDTLNNQASLYIDKNEFAIARVKYEEALMIRRHLAEENPKQYLSNVAGTLNNLGLLNSANSEYLLALNRYEEALAIYKNLLESDSLIYLPYVSLTLNNLANLHSNMYEYVLALEEYEQALTIQRKLAKENPQKYLSNIALMLNNQALIHSRRDEYTLALEKYDESLSIYRNLALENPRRFLPYVSGTLNNQANLHSAMNEFPIALQEYEETLAIWKNLAEENPQTYLIDVAKSLNNLAILYSDINKFSLAQENHIKSLEITRELAKENPSAYLPQVANTLSNLAYLLSITTEFQLALDYYVESRKIYKTLVQENPEVYEINYARTLIIGVVSFQKSPDDLKKAKVLLLKYPDIPIAQQFLKMIDDHWKKG